MRTNKAALVLVTVLMVLLSGAGLAPSAHAADKAKGKKRFTPTAGVITNNPLGGPKARQRINDRIVKTINATGKKQRIRVHSWNIRNQRIVDALVRAHRRGVSVRVIIWAGNARTSSDPSKHNPNPQFQGMRTALKKGNKKRPKARKSGTRKCKGSCRGTKGLPHSKYYLFSKANGVKNIVMYGGHNATDLAGTHQWNDIDVITEHEGIFADFERIFDESFKDRPRKNPWVHTVHGKFEPQFYPYQGKGVTGDPVIHDIRKTQCTGADPAVRKNGRTLIRVAMTSWHGPRGIEIAQELVKKQNQGCDVKVVYAVAGNEVLRVLRREGKRAVPLRQIVQDFNGDGVYDRYLHTKVMVIQGNWDGNPSASMVWNGSANWSPLVIKSDEAGMRMNAPGRAKTYIKYVNWLYANPPTRGREAARVAASARSLGIDPYANIEVD